MIRIFRSMGFAVAALISVQACAPSQPYLNEARDLCSKGNAGACANIPALANQVAAENQAASDRMVSALTNAALIYNTTHPPPTNIYVYRGW
jgi:hypothetical protein